MGLLADLVEGFNILLKYDPELDLNAEHDIIYIGPSCPEVSEEDGKRLEELRFRVGSNDCWEHYV